MTDLAGGTNLAPKGRRFAAGIVDLILVPIAIGFIVGILLLNVEDNLRNIILILLNIGWLIFRDAVYSPGRAMVGLKIVSLNGEKVTLVQALLRNILLILPVILIIGYLVEIIALLVKGERIADGWAKTRVVSNS